jgi:hypothetical protein
VVQRLQKKLWPTKNCVKIGRKLITTLVFKQKAIFA